MFGSDNDDSLIPFDAPNITFPSEVEYRVYGTFTGRYNPIDFIDENNNLETIADTLPWTYSFTVDSLRALFINTTGIQGHVITSEIWINGSLYSSLENTGPNEARKNLIWAHGEVAKIRYDLSEWIQGGFESGTVSVNSRDGFDRYNLLDYQRNNHTFFTERYDTEPGFIATMNSTTAYSATGCYLAFIALELDDHSYPLVIKNVCNPGRNTLTVTVPNK